jgi:ribosomal protein L11 methyltransferase
MVAATGAPICIELTAQQQDQYLQVTGLSISKLVIGLQHLCALLMYTEARQRGLLSHSPDLLPLSRTIELTPEQTELIRQATGREASWLTLVDLGLERITYQEKWEAEFDSIDVGRSLVIARADRARERADGRHVIALSPWSGSSQAIFGTGWHPTTQVCLALIEERLAAGSRVLDLGTGSGVLSIAAARLGAREVLALDIDPAAVETARGNVEANGLAGQVGVQLGSVEAAKGSPYDLVMANLIAGLLVALAPDLRRLVRQAGGLIVSGIREEGSAAVVEAFHSEGFHLEESRSEAGWTGLAFQRIR